MQDDALNATFGAAQIRKGLIGGNKDRLPLAEFALTVLKSTTQHDNEFALTGRVPLHAHRLTAIEADLTHAQTFVADRQQKLLARLALFMCCRSPPCSGAGAAPDAAY